MIIDIIPRYAVDCNTVSYLMQDARLDGWRDQKCANGLLYVSIILADYLTAITVLWGLKPIQVAMDQRSSIYDDCNGLLLLNSMNPESQLGSYSAHILHDRDWDCEFLCKTIWLMWTAGRWQSISPVSFSLGFHMEWMHGRDSSILIVRCLHSMQNASW